MKIDTWYTSHALAMLAASFLVHGAGYDGWSWVGWLGVWIMIVLLHTIFGPGTRLEHWLR